MSEAPANGMSSIEPPGCAHRPHQTIARRANDSLRPKAITGGPQKENRFIVHSQRPMIGLVRCQNQTSEPQIPPRRSLRLAG